VTPAR
jgi:hypothetical protein